MENEKEVVCLKGCLDVFFEEHMGGLAFVFNERGKKGYESLNLLQKGNYLKVFNGREVFWEGEIDSKMAELYSRHYKTGYSDSNWRKMFMDCMSAELYKRKR